jgi:hypothetical protein
MDNKKDLLKTEEFKKNTQDKGSSLHVNILKIKHKKDELNDVVIPMLKKSRDDVLNDWLDSRACYADYSGYNKPSRSFMEFFNHDFTEPKLENNYITPYTPEDTDVKNRAAVRYDNQYSSHISDFYGDKEITFITGSNRCSANFFYKNLLLSVEKYDTIVPMITSSNGSIEYGDKELPLIPNKEKIYDMLMKISST